MADGYQHGTDYRGTPWARVINCAIARVLNGEDGPTVAREYGLESWTFESVEALRGVRDAAQALRLTSKPSEMSTSQFLGKPWLNSAWINCKGKQVRHLADALARLYDLLDPTTEQLPGRGWSEDDD